MWQVVETKKLTKALMQDLFANKIAGIRIPRFVSPSDCQEASAIVHTHHKISALDNQLEKIGIDQFSHSNKSQFFSQVHRANNTRKQIFSTIGDPVPNILSLCKAAWGNAQAARDMEMQKDYFIGLIRVIDSLLLHVDWGPIDGPDWSIGTVEAQLAWNIYLDKPIKGGEVQLFNRQWLDGDEKHKLDLYHEHKSFGYKDTVVDGHESLLITPEVGDLLFFNSRNYHNITKSSTENKRVTVTSFIGLQDNKLILWS